MDVYMTWSQAADRSNRVGGPQSPLQSFEEAFSGQSGFDQAAFGVSALGRGNAQQLRNAGLGSFAATDAQQLRNAGLGSFAISQSQALRSSGLASFAPTINLPTPSDLLRSVQPASPSPSSISRGRDAFGEASKSLQKVSQTVNATFNVDGHFGKLSDPEVDRLVDRVIRTLSKKIDSHRRSRGPDPGGTFRQ